MSAVPYIVREILEYSDGTRKVVNFNPIPMSDEEKTEVPAEAEAPAQTEAPAEVASPSGEVTADAPEGAPAEAESA